MTEKKDGESAFDQLNALVYSGTGEQFTLLGLAQQLCVEPKTLSHYLGMLDRPQIPTGQIDQETGRAIYTFAKLSDGLPPPTSVDEQQTSYNQGDGFMTGIKGKGSFPKPE